MEKSELPPAAIPAESDKLLDTPKTAAILDIPPATLEVWRSTKRYDLPYVKVGRLVRYRLSDVLAFIAARTVA